MFRFEDGNNKNLATLWKTWSLLNYLNDRLQSYSIY